jgi:hypothetical protein
MKDKDDNIINPPNNVIVSIARLLLPEIQEHFCDKNIEKDNIVQNDLEEKNEVKPSA